MNQDGRTNRRQLSPRCGLEGQSPDISTPRCGQHRAGFHMAQHASRPATERLHHRYGQFDQGPRCDPVTGAKSHDGEPLGRTVARYFPTGVAP